MNKSEAGNRSNFFEEAKAGYILSFASTESFTAKANTNCCAFLERLITESCQD
jgi:hypothetical protein